MRLRRRQRQLFLVNPRDEASTAPESALPDGLLSIVAILVVALVPLLGYFWHPGSWGTQESIALAFVLLAGVVLTEYLRRSDDKRA